jgi:hypothetical protein
LGLSQTTIPNAPGRLLQELIAGIAAVVLERRAATAEERLAA